MPQPGRAALWMSAHLATLQHARRDRYHGAIPAVTTTGSKLPGTAIFEKVQVGS